MFAQYWPRLYRVPAIWLCNTVVKDMWNTWIILLLVLPFVLLFRFLAIAICLYCTWLWRCRKTLNLWFIICLQAIEHTFHRRSMLIAESVNHMLQHLTFMALACIDTAKVLEHRQKRDVITFALYNFFLLDFASRLRVVSNLNRQKDGKNTPGRVRLGRHVTFPRSPWVARMVYNPVSRSCAEIHNLPSLVSHNFLKTEDSTK